MDSRLIYESSKAFESKIKWTQIDKSKSEWNYYEISQPDLIEFIINDFFITDTLNISLGRNDSYTIDKSEVFEKIKHLIGHVNFKIWNETFTKTLEINKIGVYRTGIIKG